MIGDNDLPETWCGSYGTLNTRRALAEINARLQALEAQHVAPYGPQSAVMITRLPSGRYDRSHVTVHHNAPMGADAALAWLRNGRKLAFVQPTAAGAVLDALEADEQ